MTCRLVVSAVASLFTASVLLSLPVAPLLGQSRGTDSSVRLKRDATYSVPRTAWGDPDLQGFWSYNDDVDTPLERPSDLGGKSEFGDEELAAVLAERARRNVERAPTIGGETGAGPTHWYEFWNAKSTRTSKIIDPPDGRVPPLTAEARTREAARAQATRGRGPADSWTDRSLGDRCIVSRNGWPHAALRPRGRHVFSFSDRLLRDLGVSARYRLLLPLQRFHAVLLPRSEEHTSELGSRTAWR